MANPLGASVIIENIGELITLAPLVRDKRRIQITDEDLGRCRNAWLAVDANGKVEGFGSGAADARYSDRLRVDARGALVMPGFVDCHTHLVFAGSRADEFCQRLSGKTYEQIAAAGGGIRSTMAATRRASNEELRALVDHRLDQLLNLGVTTVEIKTGYGLAADQEYRQIQLLNEIRHQSRQTLSITCLALHAIPPEYDDARNYAAAMRDELLPRIVGLCDNVDAFVERGYFSSADVMDFFVAAKAAGLKVRIHADEFSDSDGGALAARVGGISADHLQFTPEPAIQQMAAKGVVAVLLPGTALYTKIPYTKARPFLEHGCPIAIGSDYNPGSCMIHNLSFLAGIAALHCGLDLPHALAAVTWVAAGSLALSHRKGALAPGFDADLVFYDFPSPEHWLWDMGGTLPREVWVGGKRI